MGNEKENTGYSNIMSIILRAIGILICIICLIVGFINIEDNGLIYWIIAPISLLFHFTVAEIIQKLQNIEDKLSK